MPREPKPWFWTERNQWVVNIDRKRYYLGDDRKAAFEEFYRLMQLPKPKRVSSHSVPAIIDQFLEWVQRHRAPDTYEWYRFRCQRFCEKYPDLSVHASILKSAAES